MTDLVWGEGLGAKDVNCESRWGGGGDGGDEGGGGDGGDEGGGGDEGDEGGDEGDVGGGGCESTWKAEYCYSCKLLSFSQIVFLSNQPFSQSLCNRLECMSVLLVLKYTCIL